MSRRQHSANTGRLIAHGLPLAAALLLTVGQAGCALWPFASKDRTSIITPSMRSAAIREYGPRARNASEAEQTEMCEQLAQQIRTEPDPIVRKAIQETVAEFNIPLAQTILVAGLSDDDRDVRITCCRKLGEQADEAAVAPLSRVVGADPEADVRMAAVKALGNFKTPAAVQGIAAALKDRDPAMQYAGVQALKRNTGEKLGNDVQAWRQYADRATGGDVPAASIAQQPADSATR